MKRRTLWLIAAAAVLILGAALFAVKLRRPATPTEVFDAAWSIVDQHYYDASFDGVDWAAKRAAFRPRAEASQHTMQLYAEAIWPMLNAFDASHIGATPPEDAALPPNYTVTFPDAMSRRGAVFSFGDLGGMLMAHDGAAFVVVEVRNGGEPERLGIEPGWTAASVNLAPSDTPNRVRASVIFQTPAGEARELGWDFAMSAPPPVREAVRTESGALLVRFDTFDRATVVWAIEQIGAAGPGGVILDLRANGGGRITALVEIASVLLPNGTTLGVRIDRSGPRTLRTSSGAKYDGPLAVLIGLRTSSAAEMLAAALRDHGRAVLVGERSAGVVLQSRTWSLPDGGAITVPQADFLTSVGVRLEGAGVTPQIAVRETLEAIRADRDLVIEAAEAALEQRSADRRRD